MLKIKNVSKDFYIGHKKIKAVNNLTLTVNKGEVFGFMGPNGAGKTTTLKLLLGFLLPSNGEILINNLSPSNISTKKHIGFLPENPFFYKYLTGFEFLFFCGKLFQIPSDILKKRISKLLKIISLKKDQNTSLRYYSKGMLQRMGIAQSLINNPDLIIFDEPMSGLDPLGRKDVKDIIIDLKNQGKTVFFSTHILEDVEAVCDRIGIIHKGKLLACGKIKTLTNGKSLESYFMKIIKNQ